MYQRFTPSEKFTGIDYIIVGSGIGGLSTAALLSKAGKKVLVLERHYVPGGFSHTFKRKDGFVWDVGVHYVGNMESTSFLRKIFSYLTDNKLAWESMGKVYDEVNIGDDKYVFPAGKENLRKALHNYYPDEKKAIDIYLKHIARAATYSSLFFVQKSFPVLLQFTIGAIFKQLFYRYSSQTTHALLKKITANEKLISVLCAQCGNYGLPPRKSSFAAHAVIVNHFMEGGYYPIGGADKIHKGLISTIEANKGLVRIKAQVEKIVIEKNSVKGVMVNNTFIACNHVISNAGVQNTFSKLVQNNAGAIALKKVNHIKPSTSHLCLYIGLNRSDAELKLPRHNVWFYDSYDFDGIIERNKDNAKAPLQFAYISFPSAKDPEWEIKNPAKATIQAVGVANYEWFKEFEDKPWMDRGDVYNGIKEDFKIKMIDKLYHLYPQLKGHIVCAEVSSPLTTKHFTNYQHGEIYGLEHSCERFKLNMLKPQTSIKGLYLVGQDIITVGVGGALASGLLCATAILKFKIAKHFTAIAKS